jgi:uncharacterized protein
VVEWTAAQPWCDGNIGMVGISAFAMTQVEAAIEQPPHLKAIFPVAASLDLMEAMYHGGLLSTSFATAWLSSVAKMAGIEDKKLRGSLLRLAEDFLKSGAVHEHLQHINGESALTVMAKLLPPKRPADAWGALYDGIVVEHQTRDAFWQERNMVTLLDQVRVPTYVGCDWENVAMHLPATFAALDGLPKDIPVRAALMGTGGLTWPWESLHVEALAWFDYWLKGRDTGIMEGPPIRFALPEAEGWRTAESWPPPSMPVQLNLTADGSLAAAGAAPGSRSYMALPAGLRPKHEDPSGPATSLTWLSQPLASDIDVAGPVELVLEATISASDTAWIATLQDVAPDGKGVDVTAGWLRASMRALDENHSLPGRPVHPLDRVETVPAGECVTYRIGLVDTARRFRQGHRLALVLRSDDSQGSPAIMSFRHQPLGSTSENTIHASSRLVLPVMAGSSALA